MKSKTTKKRKPFRRAAIAYTHRDASGMLWRFTGSRPVSALADKVMAQCGLPLR